jgi:2',3'-cyclic-nucleotide 2'-phosphodiesterase (5'-nucleotidase family)
MMDATNTTICVFNSGAVRIDDQLMGTISEYDILRCLPFTTNLITIHVNSSILVKILNRGLMNINTGMFISYAGLIYDAKQEKWYLESNKQSLDDDDKLQLIFVSIPYFYHNTDLKYSSEILKTYTTMTKTFIDYLERTYPKTIHHKPY